MQCHLWLRVIDLVALLPESVGSSPSLFVLHSNGISRPIGARTCACLGDLRSHPQRRYRYDDPLSPQPRTSGQYTDQIGTKFGIQQLHPVFQPLSSASDAVNARVTRISHSALAHSHVAAMETVPAVNRRMRRYIKALGQVGFQGLARQIVRTRTPPLGDPRGEGLFFRPRNGLA